MKARDLKSQKNATKLPTAGAASIGRKVMSLRESLESALKSAGHLPKPTKKNPYVMGGIEEMYDNTVVFYKDYGTFLACNYELDKDGSVTLTAPIEVERRTSYVPKGS